jgi:hypothetical protein
MSFTVSAIGGLEERADQIKPSVLSQFDNVPHVVSGIQTPGVGKLGVVSAFESLSLKNIGYPYVPLDNNKRVDQAPSKAAVKSNNLSQGATKGITAVTTGKHKENVTPIVSSDAVATALSTKKETPTQTFKLSDLVVGAEIARCDKANALSSGFTREQQKKRDEATALPKTTKDGPGEHCPYRYSTLSCFQFFSVYLKRYPNVTNLVIIGQYAPLVYERIKSFFSLALCFHVKEYNNQLPDNPGGIPDLNTLNMKNTLMYVAGRTAFSRKQSYKSKRNSNITYTSATTVHGQQRNSRKHDINTKTHAIVKYFSPCAARVRYSILYNNTSCNINMLAGDVSFATNFPNTIQEAQLDIVFGYKACPPKTVQLCHDALYCCCYILNSKRKEWDNQKSHPPVKLLLPGHSGTKESTLDLCETHTKKMDTIYSFLIMFEHVNADRVPNITCTLLWEKLQTLFGLTPTSSTESDVPMNCIVTG